MKAVWLGKNSDGEKSGSTEHNLVDKVTGVRKPTYKRPYNPTRLNGNHNYHCISMMMVRTLQSV